MAVLVSAILDDAAVYLNDATKSRFTYAVLLPYVKRAHKQLQLELHLNDVSALLEVSALDTVLAGATVMTTQPTDLIEPSGMWERLLGSTDTLNPMTRKEFEPEEIAGASLTYWTWREQVITFIGATTDRQVKLRYLKSATAITNEASSVSVLDADLYLAPYTAGLAAKYIGENYERGQQLMNEAEINLNKVIRRNVKKRQGLTGRRKSFTTNLRRGGRY